MEAKRRKPWAAALLSVALPGLGQVYNGQAKKGIIFFCLYLAGVLGSLIVMLEVPAAPFNIVLPLAIIIAIYIYITIDAILISKRLGEMFKLRAYNRWYVYLAAIVSVGFVMQPLIRGTVVESFKMPSGSMADTLLIGDYFLVNKFTYGFQIPVFGTWVVEPRTPERGDIIIFKYPYDETRMFIKRVIGLPGETIEIRAKQVFINGKRLTEPYAQYVDSTAPQIPPSTGDFYGPETIPAGKLFVLGDNIEHSQDSRFWGFLDEKQVVGKARRIYWSWDTLAQRVRSKRIGQTVQ